MTEARPIRPAGHRPQTESGPQSPRVEPKLVHSTRKHLTPKPTTANISADLRSPAVRDTFALETVGTREPGARRIPLPRGEGKRRLLGRGCATPDEAREPQNYRRATLRMADALR